MAFKIDPDGWIEGITEYAGCGSHSCEWISDSGKSLLIHAPELLEALEALVYDAEPIYSGKHNTAWHRALTAIAKAKETTPATPTTLRLPT